MKPLSPEKGPDRTNLFLKLLILIWPFLFIWQGIDLTDTGYLLTGGQQVFIEPQNVQFSYILSFLINGVWRRLTEPFGLMGAYLGSALVYLLTAFFVYRSFRKLISERTLLLGLLIAMMIPNLLRYINYNNLTSLFFVIGSGFLLKAYSGRSPWHYFFAGVIFGSSFYLRLPNLVSVFLLLGILIGHYFDGSGWKDAFKGVLSFLSGFFGALVIPFLILHISGLSDQYFETFHRLWAILVDPSSHHSGEGLIRKIITDFDRTFAAFFHCFLILVVLGKINDLARNRVVAYTTIAFAMLVIGLIGFGFIGNTVVYHYYLLAFIAFVLILQVFGFSSTGKDVRFASLVAFMVMMFATAGSNTGLSAARYDLWLALPLSLNGLFNLKGLYLCDLSQAGKRMENEKKCISFLSDQGIGLARKIICISMILFFLILCYRFTHKDSDRRYLLRYSVDHPKLKYVLTTRNRAEVIDEALKELSKYVIPGDYLLAYNYIPLVYYLTDTRPYAYHSWPELYSSEQLIEKLKQAISERPGLPTVIRAKYPPINDSWPQMHLSSRGSPRHHQVFDEFLKQGKFVQVWENEFFQILLPPAPW